MEIYCKICGLKIILSDTNLYAVLTEKGVNRINNAKKRTGDSRVISTGELVHIAYQARYVNSKTIEQDLKRKNSKSDEGQPSPKKLRSICHLSLKLAACIASKPLQTKNLETAKLSKLCLRIGNLTRRF